MRRSQRCSRGCQITLSRRLQGTWTPTRKRLYHSRREYTIATHLRRGAVDMPMVSGGGTIANEAGFLRD